MDLLERILHRPNMQRAFKRVKSNKGSGGVDGIEMEGFKAQIEDEWPFIKTEILEGVYQPEPLRRVEIEKPSGGTRLLGIPTLMDRMIQQGIAQELTILYDGIFSENSYGFRPKRNAHQGLLKARAYVNEGYSYLVDIDLEQFFDRVNHDYLLTLLSKRIKDKRVLKLIHRYLQAGAMEEGVARVNREGTPQGGPLSPILSNILLDELDRELEKRGHKFVRYADDICIFARSERGSERVLSSISKFIERVLKLKVNRVKSKTTRPGASKLLGYSFYKRKNGTHGLLIGAGSIKKYKDKVRKITCRSTPIGMYSRYEQLASLNRGWYNYFKLSDARSIFSELDGWVRRRLRLCYWKQWGSPKTRANMLRKQGILGEQAYSWSNTRKGCWRISGSRILSNAFGNSYLRREGYLSLKELSILPNTLF
ncbi:group II intron reverse transcriptase/maturase [Chitinophaga ginsengisoli]|uniref:RNA-directed DNA polymerase n=1 Tax=Chitinophaga ginsengisoli TaxID=363837 RepID=A0A2P8F763_9BACT|nr:group II intron reverse transcriptase/maturase [Chitinophaga ginsengisoli]PSL17553.1 group II intron reverse transcriptase/maturase [Chitinophaga ginsengisoli]